MSNALVRPTNLSDPVQVRILDYLKAGNYLKTACEASGITYKGFRHWQRRYEEGDPGATRFADFFEAVKLAVSVGEAQALSNLRTGNPGWQAQAWFLERRFPQRWGKKDQLTIKGADVKKLTDEELQSIAEGKG